MSILIIGLVLFIGIHFLPIFTGIRNGLRDRLGESPYKGLYSLIAITGLGLTIWGYALARYDQPLLWTPPEWGPHLTALLMFISFIFIVAGDFSGKIKDVVRHPMITGVGFWATAHLFSNGGLADLLLFGGFLTWAIIGRISMGVREAAGVITVKEGGPLRNDVIAVAAAAVLYGLFIWIGHEWIIGVPAVAF